MSATPQFDYSNDIDALEDLSDGEQSVETAEELFGILQNPESVKFLLNNSSETHSAKFHPSDDDYGNMDAEGVIHLERSNAYQETIDDLKEYQELREKAFEHGEKRGLGKLGFIPGLVENPVSKGYNDAKALEEFSKEKLDSIITGELEYGTSSTNTRRTVGSASMFGGLGAIASETFEAITYQMESVLRPETLQQAPNLADGPLITGTAAFAYGLSLVHQSSFYQNGIEMRARDEHVQREAEELREEYKNWLVD